MTAIIGFESSCDETAVAVVVDGRKVLSNAIASQIAKHAVYGGVVPELAAREHLTAIRRVTDESLKEAGVTTDQIDAVAVTNGPGLVPALLVGVNFAKGFAAAYKKPLIGINHFLGHIYGVFLDQEEDVFAKKELFPMVGLVVSGGHTSLVLIREDGTANVIGTTLDDAAGEAFDKAAKMLNLGYPGGPVIEKAARNGDPHRFSFPRSLTGTAGKALAPENRFNFSFSGVKTALLYHAKKICGENTEALDGQDLYDTLASYQDAIVGVLCEKAFDAARFFHAKSLILCGGVACNGYLREHFEAGAPKNVKVLLAPRKYCTDNAAMIAGLACRYYRAGEFADMSLDAYARIPREFKIPFQA